MDTDGLLGIFGTSWGKTASERATKNGVPKRMIDRGDVFFVEGKHGKGDYIRGGGIFLKKYFL